MLFDKNGKGKVFQHEGEVPEGYFYESSCETSFGPQPAAKADNSNKGLAKELGFRKQELVAALTEAGIAFPANATADDLAAIYQKAAAEEDEEEADEDEHEDEV